MTPHPHGSQRSQCNALASRCRENLFKSKLVSASVSEMYRNNLEGLSLLLHPWDNKCVLDFAPMWLDKLLRLWLVVQKILTLFFFIYIKHDSRWEHLVCLVMWCEGCHFCVQRNTLHHCEKILSDAMLGCKTQVANMRGDSAGGSSPPPLLHPQVLHWGGDVMLMRGWYNGPEVTGDLMRGTRLQNVFRANPLFCPCKWLRNGGGRAGSGSRQSSSEEIKIIVKDTLWKKEETQIFCFLLNGNHWLHRLCLLKRLLQHWRSKAGKVWVEMTDLLFIASHKLQDLFFSF